MAKDDARYTGSFFNSYTNTRMKLHRHCVPLDDDPAKIAEIYGYPRQQVDEIFAELERDLQEGVNSLKGKFHDRLDEKLKGRSANLVFIGDQLTSEYLSYYNIIKKIFEEYEGVEVSIAGNTGDNSNQSLQYIYGLAVSRRPVITSIFIGINDVFYAADPYRKTIASRREYRDNIDYLTKVMLHNGSKVVLHTLPPVDSLTAAKTYRHMNWKIDNEEILARNEDIRQIAARNRCMLNDIEAALRTFDGVVNVPENGVLLTKEAQRFIAEKLTEILLEQL